MGEYFELTFFSPSCSVNGMNDKKNILEFLSLSEGRNQLTWHTYPLFENREVIFDVFQESKFCEYRICLSDFIITKENFHQKERQLLQIADICLSRIDSILFATGIYELTSYLTSSITDIESFDKGILTKFPFIFLRNRNEYDLVPIDQYNDTICILNTGGDVQDIFSDV